MRNTFFLFNSHLDLAHAYWQRLVQPGDDVIDATCGNGHDTLYLCQLALTPLKGKVYAFDIQKEAINSTEQYVKMHLSEALTSRLFMEQRCHSSFPTDIPLNHIKLIVYNLGYLPGGNKSRTTQLTTTLQSLQHALTLLQPGGAVSLTCYPGHTEGAQEQKALMEFVKALPPKEWSCCHHQWLNRQHAPNLILIQKTLFKSGN